MSIANGRHVGDTGSIAKTQSMGECIKSIFEDSFVKKGLNSEQEWIPNHQYTEQFGHIIM